MVHLRGASWLCVIAGEEPPACALPAPEAMPADVAENTCNLLYVSDFVSQFKDWLRLTPMGFLSLRTAVHATAVDGMPGPDLKAGAPTSGDHQDGLPASSSSAGAQMMRRNTWAHLTPWSHENAMLMWNSPA